MAWLLVPAGWRWSLGLVRLVAAGREWSGQADLPGMSGVIGWAALAIGVCWPRADIDAARPAGQRRDADRRLLGDADAGVRLAEHPAARGLEVWVAHLIGPVTSNAAKAVADRAGVPALPNRLGHAAGGVGGRAGRRRVRGGRGRPVAAGPNAAPPRRPGIREGCHGVPGSGLTGPRKSGTGPALAPFAAARRRQRRRTATSKDWERKAWPGSQFLRARAARRRLAAVAHRRRAADHGRVRLAAARRAARADPQPRHRPGRAGAARAERRSCTRPGATRPSGAPSGCCGTSAPSGRGPTIRCRPRATPNGPYRNCSAGCGGCTTTAAGSSWSRTARAPCSAPRRSSQPDCRPDGDWPALITFGSPLVKLYGWAFPAYFEAALLGRLVPGGTGGAQRLAQLLLPDRPHRRPGRP